MRNYRQPRRHELSRGAATGVPTAMTDPDLARAAREALEHVCSGAGREPATRYYSPQFVDHVNDMELRGLEGVRQSVAMYTRVLDELEIAVHDQLVDGDRVTSRFVV